MRTTSYDLDELLNRCNLVESLLEEVTIVDHLRKVIFRFRVSRMNLVRDTHTISEQKEWYIDIICSRFLSFKVERESLLIAQPSHPLDASSDAQVGRKTVIGFVRKELKRPHKNKHDLSPYTLQLKIETMDPYFEIICEEVRCEEWGLD